MLRIYMTHIFCLDPSNVAVRAVTILISFFNHVSCVNEDSQLAGIGGYADSI